MIDNATLNTQKLLKCTQFINLSRSLTGRVTAKVDLAILKVIDSQELTEKSMVD